VERPNQRAGKADHQENESRRDSTEPFCGARQLAASAGGTACQVRQGLPEPTEIGLGNLDRRQGDKREFRLLYEAAGQC
jgi:hypothetical protein